MIKRRVVISTIKVVGFHCWGEAPEVVRYLAARHRHEFTIRVEVDVSHADRDVEFHMLQDATHRAMCSAFDHEGETPRYNFGSRSCEMIAIELAVKLDIDEGVVPSAIEVWEDGECGGRVEFG